MSPLIRGSIHAAAASACIVAASFAGATDVAKRPINAGGLVRPNVIVAYDNSGSMNLDILLPTNDGQAYWHTGAQGIWDKRTGKFYSDAEGGPSRIAYGYIHVDGIDNYAPPTKDFAAVRSSYYNPLYFDPDQTYEPWPASFADGKTTTYSDQDPKATKDQPELTFGRNLTASTKVRYIVRKGMTLPSGSTMNGTTYTAPKVVEADGYATIPYYPPTYWKKETCDQRMEPDNCTEAPGGGTLRRYEIPASSTKEMQNFANWWTYYRHRSLMAASAVGIAFKSLTNVRVGVTRFNNPSYNSRRPNVTMYDADDPAPGKNLQAALGYVLGTANSSTTPTADAMIFAGEQFRTNTSVIQYACQRNSMLVVTDGFASTDKTMTVPPYDETAYGSEWPYANTPKDWLADIALSYYTGRSKGQRFIREKDFSGGQVAELKGPSMQDSDLNTDLHVNTYAITLGVSGEIWQGQAHTNPPRSWPTPELRTAKMIDDLWHATINGRGRMFDARNAFDAAARLVETFENMTRQSGGQGPLAVSSPDLALGDGKVYAATYDGNGWGGNVIAWPVDKATGVVDTLQPKWKAADRLSTRTTARLMATSDGSKGIPFAGPPDDTDANLPNNAEVEYLRGSRAGEGTLFRTRKSLLGAAINGQPLIDDGVVYAATGEGFLHAFSAETGDELWAFAPYSVRGQLKQSTRRTWSFKTLLDGSPQIAKVGQQKFLFVERGIAGTGVMALDVTNAAGIANESELAARWKWEFPSKDITTAGLTMGRPVVVPTRSSGTVVLITQGYNGTANDGNGRVYMLDAASGTLLHTFVANGGGNGTGDPGLVQLSAMAEGDGFVRYVYGGDERGNLWRFDLQEKATKSIAKLVDASGEPQPITAAPELARIGGQRIVIVGTGRLLGLADFVASGQGQRQSFYAIKDDDVAITDVRKQLVTKTLVQSTPGKWILKGDKFAWDDILKKGWFFDLPTDYKANTAPQLARGLVWFNANKMTTNDCKGSMANLAVDLRTGEKFDNRDTVMTEVLGVTGSEVTLLATTGPAGTGSSVGGGTSTCWQNSLGEVVCKDAQAPGSLTPRKNAWRILYR